MLRKGPRVHFWGTWLVCQLITGSHWLFY